MTEAPKERETGCEKAQKTTFERQISTNVASYNSSMRWVDPRMHLVFLLSMACALVYIMFPVLTQSGQTNYWAYYLAKQQWWSFFGNAAFIEIAETCMPGSPVHTYVYSYTFGWLTPGSLRILAWALNVPSSTVFDVLCVTTSIITITFFYGYWQLTTGSAEETMTRFRLSTNDDGVTHDMFSAAMDLDSSETYFGNRGSAGASMGSTQHAVTADGLVDSNPTIERGRTNSGIIGYVSRDRAMWMRTLRRFRIDAKEEKVEMRRTRELRTSSMDCVSNRGSSIAAGATKTPGDGKTRIPFSPPTSTTMNPVNRDSVKTINSDSGCFDDAMSMAAEYDETEEQSEYQMFLFEENSMFAFCNTRWYRVLPRFWFRSFGELPGAHVTTRHRIWHFLYTIGYCFGWIIVFLILTEFTFAFRASVTDSNRVKWFVMFVFASSLCKISMKRLGMMLDRGKIGTCSMYFVSEVMCTLFYFTFYRMLFEDFVGWGTFAAVQALHFCAEWCMYCVRATRCFYNGIKHSTWLGPMRYIIILPGLSYRDWQVFLALDFALKVSITLYSVPGFLVLLLVTDQCYWIKSALKPLSYIHLQYVMAQIGLCVVLEVVNAWVMYKVFFKANNLQVHKYSSHCFSSLRFCVVCGAICVCLFINPFAAFENYTGSFTYK